MLPNKTEKWNKSLSRDNFHSHGREISIVIRIEPQNFHSSVIAKQAKMGEESKVEQTMEDIIRKIDKDVTHYQKKCRHPEKIVSLNFYNFSWNVEFLIYFPVNLCFGGLFLMKPQYIFNLSLFLMEYFTKFAAFFLLASMKFQWTEYWATFLTCQNFWLMMKIIDLKTVFSIAWNLFRWVSTHQNSLSSVRTNIFIQIHSKWTGNRPRPSARFLSVFQ